MPIKYPVLLTVHDVIATQSQLMAAAFKGEHGSAGLADVGKIVIQTEINSFARMLIYHLEWSLSPSRCARLLLVSSSAMILKITKSAVLLPAQASKGMVRSIADIRLINGFKMACMLSLLLMEDKRMSLRVMSELRRFIQKERFLPEDGAYSLWPGSGIPFLPGSRYLGFSCREA